MQLPAGPPPMLHQHAPPQGHMYGQPPPGPYPRPSSAPSSPYAPRAPYAANAAPPPQLQGPPQHPPRPQYQSGPSAPLNHQPAQHQPQYQGQASPSRHLQQAPPQHRPGPQGYQADGGPRAALGSKRRLEDGLAPEAKRPAPGGQSVRETIFRLLSSSKKVGSIIGRGGETIKQLKAETGARLKVADAVPNCEERVVIVSSDFEPEVQWNCAQRALLEVHRRLLESDYSMTAGSTAPVVSRFLVNQSQANHLLQRLDVTNMVRGESGVDVKVLGPQELPACALSNDRVLQLTGTAQQFPRALEILSQHFRENPPRERPGSAPPAIAALLSRPDQLCNAGNAQTPPQFGGPPTSYSSQPPQHHFTAAPAPQYGAPATGPSSYLPPPQGPVSQQGYPPAGVMPQYGAPPGY